jgi:hypothetical protein
MLAPTAMKNTSSGVVDIRYDKGTSKADDLRLEDLGVDR